MCNNYDDSCRQEKLGCKGCFYERKSNYNDLLNTLINTDFLESACSEETANDYKQAIEQLIYENMELKAITKTYNTEKDDDKIILADKRYFDCGVFSDNLIPKSKIIKKLNEFENDCSLLCNFRGELCDELCKNNQCVTNSVKNILKELLESEETND